MAEDDVEETTQDPTLEEPTTEGEGTTGGDDEDDAEDTGVPSGV